ncbi:MAG: hypothetical protein JSU82_10025 [Rhodospirillales bacterium]|nr:MAG: hypothetical protein JSU82_10025 [Rhodospirillales bacterium]
MIKGEIACVPRDEDVVGDRMVFSFEKSSPSHDATLRLDGGDPLYVSPALADIVQPLGQSVVAENRSSAVAAVAADPVPFQAMFAGAETASWTARVSGLVKSKTPIPAALPERATRLWLPVE